MTKPEIISEIPIHHAEIEEELKTIQKRDTELSFRGGKTVEYINSCDKLSKKQSDELKKKLEDMKIPRFTEKHIIKICNILPATNKEVQTVIQGYSVSITKENLEKIAKTVSEYV